MLDSLKYQAAAWQPDSTLKIATHNSPLPITKIHAYINWIMSSSYYSGNNSNSIEAIVVDIGAGLTKMGWAGDDYPRSIFRSVCGYVWLIILMLRLRPHNIYSFSLYHKRRLRHIVIPKLDVSKPMHLNMITLTVQYSQMVPMGNMTRIILLIWILACSITTIAIAIIATL